MKNCKWALICLLCSVGILGLVNGLPPENTPISPSGAANDYEFVNTDQSIDALGWYTVYGERTGGTELLAFFETDSAVSGVKAFFCSDAEYAKWENGQAATVYQLIENIYWGYIQFTAPHTDTWHVVIENTNIREIEIDILFETGSSHVPYVSVSTHDYGDNHVALEDGDSQMVNLGKLSKNTGVDLGYDTMFTTDGVDCALLDQSQWEKWSDGETVYPFFLKDGYHKGSFSADIPYTDTWYCVFLVTGDNDVVSVCYGIDITKPFMDYLLNPVTILALLAVVGLTIGLAATASKRKKEKLRTATAATGNAPLYGTHTPTGPAPRFDGGTYGISPLPAGSPTENTASDANSGYKPEGTGLGSGQVSTGGSTRCPNCQVSIPPGSQFCQSCGYKCF